jgi:hypothetical protein
VTLSPSQSVSFSVVYAPTTGGSTTGSLTVVSGGSNSSVGVSLSGTGAAPGTLSPSPSSLLFKDVQVGHAADKFETLTNLGGSSVTISQASLTASAFSMSGLILPATLNPGERLTFTVTFAPVSAGSASGNLNIVSDASSTNLSIGLTGDTAASGQVSISPASLGFGTVNVGSSSSLSASLSATGADVTVSSVTSSSGEFSLSGISLPVTIPAGQSAPFTVTFTPNTAGTASANLTFLSDASNSAALPLTGTGQAQSHWVGLSWNPSSDAVSYNVYRKASTDQNYTQIGSGDGSTSYTDNGVTSGVTYEYAVTGVNAENQESGYSNIAQAVIPNN